MDAYGSCRRAGPAPGSSGRVPNARIELGAPVAKLAISTRAKNGLARSGMHTAWELRRQDAQSLISAGGIGRQRIKGYASALAAYGLRMGMSVAESRAYAARRPLRIDISGDTSERDGERRALGFGKAARDVAAALPGWDIVNPLCDGAVHGGAMPERMRRSMGTLVECAAIYMADGWRSSAVCREGLAAAISMGLHVFFERGAALPPSRESRWYERGIP